MHSSHLAMKRSHSECLGIGARIYSPSPIKKASRISTNVARELFAIPPRIEEFEFDFEEAAPIPGIFKAKSCIFRIGQDSSMYKIFLIYLSNINFSEWSSDSSGTGTSGDLESPTRSTSKNPLFQDDILEDITVEIPCRTSNPITNDKNFARHHEQKGCGFQFLNHQSSVLKTSN